MKHSIQIGPWTIDSESPLFLISGPCVIETEEMTLEIARFLSRIGKALDIPVIFKTSYDKANRTSLNSFRGPGLEKGLQIIKKVKDETGLPVLSDVHNVDEIERAAEVLDVIQIPAFLCRQSDLLQSVARTGLPVNIKKGQFLSPWDIKPAIQKVTAMGNHAILLTERGTSFGYNNLVVDMRSIAIMKETGFPVVFDATHSVQLPGGNATSSGGQREFVPHLSKAAVAAGADGVFMEVHPDPDSALCDGPNSLPLHEVNSLLVSLKKIHELLKV
ncbi:MAG: 3-deoxy-8-phosphooctulonate synthase [Thermodesulfobacteriota bacterium]|nr:3-deoxy-8-phosphooctulonate synthase [Thermodesulfobacteriota bacterium]